MIDINIALEVWNFMLMLLLPVALLILIFYIVAISKAVQKTLRRKSKTLKGTNR